MVEYSWLIILTARYASATRSISPALIDPASSESASCALVPAASRRVKAARRLSRGKRVMLRMKMSSSIVYWVFPNRERSFEAIPTPLFEYLSNADFPKRNRYFDRKSDTLCMLIGPCVKTTHSLMRHSQRWPRAGTWKRERERLAKAGGDDVKRGAGPAFQERQISCSRYEMSERLQSADAAVHPDLPDWQFAGTQRWTAPLR